MTDLRIPRLEPPNEPREKKFTSDNGDSFVTSKISAVGDFVDKVADWIGASPGGPDTTDDSESSVDFALGNGGGVTGSFSFDTDTDKGSLSLGGYAGVGGDMAISFDFGDGVFSGLANAKLESFSVGYGAVAGAKLGINGMSVGLSGKVELGLHYDENGLYIGPQMQAGFHLLDLVVIQAEVVGGARVPYTQDIFPPVYDFGMAVPDAGILGGSGAGFGFEFGVPLNQGSGELASSEAAANKAAAKSGGNDRDRDPSSGGGAGITLSKTKPGQAGGGNQDWKDAKNDTKAGSAPSKDAARPDKGAAKSAPERPDNPTDQKPNPDKAKAKSQPILLDLDGDGVRIDEISRSNAFVDAGGEGLSHRSAWAAAGDGVLFYDPDGRNDITEKRQYVFTEWDPTATSDLAAVRAVFDSNGDGKLTALDAEFAKFKVMVTNADGSRSAKTLTELGITEINLTADATHITLPDGSVITGQTRPAFGVDTRRMVA